MTLLGDLQAAEPSTVTPAHFDAWVRSAHADLEALLVAAPPTKPILATTAIATSYATSYGSTTDPSEKLVLPGATLSLVVPPSGFFYVYLGIHGGNMYVKNAFGWLQLLDSLDVVIAETIFAISRVEYGAYPSTTDPTITTRTYSVKNQIIIMCNHAAGANLELSVALSSSDVHQNTSVTGGSFNLGYSFGGSYFRAPFMIAYAL